MFGYLNTNNARHIGETEAQEAKNVSIEKNYIEYREYETDALNNVKLTLPNGQIVMIDLDTPKFGQVKWKSSEDGTLEPFGLDAPNAIVTDNDPWTTVSKVPTVSNAAYGSNPYPAGSYTYAVTLYDPDTGEESIPATWDVTTVDHSTPGSETIQFANFPDVSAYFPGRTNLQWRIYRRPQGGSEYLLVNGGTTISANSVYAGPYQDIIADQDLGIPCDSLDDDATYLRSQYAVGVALFNDHLFVFGSQDNVTRVNFSRQGKWWAFPAANEINMPGTFTGACETNEQLLLFSTEGIYVLYGDNIDNFALKKSDFDLTGQDNLMPTLKTARSVGGGAIFAVSQNLTLDEYGDEYTGIPYIVMTNGGQTVNITERIRDLFPMAEDSLRFIVETAIIENRFYAIKLIDIDATVSAVIASGRDFSEGTTDDYIFITLVYDTYAKGWLTANDAGVFSYRTKEFAMPRMVQFHKRIWIESEGDCVLQFMGDNNIISSLNISHATKQKKYYNIKASRYDAFSFRIVGQQNCKVYDFGVDE